MNSMPNAIVHAKAIVTSRNTNTKKMAIKYNVLLET